MECAPLGLDKKIYFANLHSKKLIKFIKQIYDKNFLKKIVFKSKNLDIKNYEVNFCHKNIKDLKGKKR